MGSEVSSTEANHAPRREEALVVVAVVGWGVILGEISIGSGSFFFFLMTFVLMWSGKCLLQLRILLCFPTAHPSHPRLLLFLNSHIKVYEAFHFESSRLFEAIGKKKNNSSYKANV